MCPELPDDGHDVALRKWFNPKYLALMKETGEEAWTSVKAIAGY
jgi:hypothetical protein